MKEHTELTLGSYKKWDLVRYIVKLEKRINRAIKRLDKMNGVEIGKTIQILRGDK